MRKLSLLLSMALVGGGVWFFRNYEVHGLDQLRVTPRGAVAGQVVGPQVVPQQVDAPPVARTGPTIRVASFNIQVFGESKLAKANVMAVLADTIRRFDVVAVQEVRATSQDVLPKFIAMINSKGGTYDYVLGPRLGRTSSKEQYAFIYNRASVELHASSVYTVEDPDDRLHREPLVAGFTVRGPPAAQAFTFTLINIHTDPDEVKSEMDALDDVYRAVRDDGQHEDDIILLGDLNTDDAHLGELGQMPYLAAAITKQPSNTRGTKLYDNIIFDRRATTEFTGRSGVLNLMKEYNLPMAEALEVSDHFPVYAEFSVYEGGGAGGLAQQPGEGATR